MNRRAFLRLTVKGRERVLELSCERLYMRYVDARARVGSADAREELLAYLPAWEGEPPLAVASETSGELFEELERRLSGVEVLRVIDPEWLTGEEFRREVESRIEAFRRRGGRVE